MSQNTDLVRQQLESTLESTSTLKSLQRELGADNPMLLIDASGSMDARMMNSKRRIDGLREVLSQLQGVPMIVFGGCETSEPHFVDRCPEPGGGTPLHLAIALAKAHGATRAVCISDGIPDLQKESLEQARNFGGKIDVVFVGDIETPDGKMGAMFLDELARITGGKRLVGSLVDTKEITGKVVLLLEGEVAPTTKTVFTGAAGAPTTVAVEDAEEVEEDDEDDEEDEDDDEQDEE
jgi:hypothetical protein